jgi:hypothetical protein
VKVPLPFKQIYRCDDTSPTAYGMAHDTSSAMPHLKKTGAVIKLKDTPYTLFFTSSIYCFQHAKLLLQRDGEYSEQFASTHVHY